MLDELTPTSFRTIVDAKRPSDLRLLPVTFFPPVSLLPLGHTDTLDFEDVTKFEEVFFYDLTENLIIDLEFFSFVCAYTTNT
ncbi:hypothetical protein STEG23_000924 [Scotinomys teguina]